MSSFIVTFENVLDDNKSVSSIPVLTTESITTIDHTNSAAGIVDCPDRFMFSTKVMPCSVEIVTNGFSDSFLITAVALGIVTINNKSTATSEAALLVMG